MTTENLDAPIDPPSPSWVEIVSEEYGFKAAFPESPREEPMPNQVSGTDIRRWTTKGVQQDGAIPLFADQRPLVTLAVCVMSEWLWGQCAGFETVNIGQGILSSETLGASRVLVSQEVDFAGLRGWAVLASKSGPKGEFRLESRTLVSRPRMYMLGVKIPARWGAEAASRYAARYFDSFELLSPAESS